MITAVMVAAGRGTRMGPNTDKLFLTVAGKPLFHHTWACFDRVAILDEIVIVVREGMQSVFAELAVQGGFRKPYRLVAGGAERQDSVWNGLAAVSASTEIVVIQDAARPCTTERLIRATIDAARHAGAAVAAQRVTDTIKESDGGSRIFRTVDRSRLWSVQTPQTFRLEVIRHALTAARAKGLTLTDDTAACELIGQPVQLVEGDSPNPKATSSADLPFLELLLSGKARS